MDCNNPNFYLLFKGQVEISYPSSRENCPAFKRVLEVENF